MFFLIWYLCLLFYDGTNKKMTTNITDKDGWLSLEGVISDEDFLLLSKLPHIDKLSVIKQPLITESIAKRFSSIQSINSLWLWCTTTRAAMQHITTLEGLNTLDLLSLKKPGKLINFANAENLRVLRCNNDMNEADLLEVANLPNLEELGAQNSEVTKRALNALLRMPNLKKLDLEATKFDDKWAKRLAASETITHLDIGAGRLTNKGLKEICKMSQLQSLDIWWTNVDERGLDLLANLPNLDYLSIGGYDGQTTLTAKGVIPRLEAIKSLKKVWLDGISLTEAENKTLKERYEYMRN